MAMTSDRAEIRAVLERDRPWSVYALGDLDPGMFEDCEWHVAREALVLLYRGFGVPVLFATGEADAVPELLAESGEGGPMYLSVRPEVLDALRSTHRIDDEEAMWRMVLGPATLDTETSDDVRRLGAEDLPALLRLHEDGAAEGEKPEFFAESMLSTGAYVGMSEGDDLIASAGTHLVSVAESVAAIGNVYVRRDRRGQGLGTTATTAVARTLVEMGIRTIALNVAQTNAVAIRAYERVGFRKYCEFYEGVAVAAV